MNISVVIPTFNRSQTIVRAIDSVLNQTHRDFELIIVDDGSTDHTFELVESHYKDSRLKLIRQRNLGVSAARNLGIESCSHDWIAFLDSDDQWLPNKLSVQIEKLKQNENIRFIHSNEYWIKNGKKINIPKKFDKGPHDIFYRSLQTCLISPSTVLAKKSLLKEYDMFDTSFEICEDYDLWLKVLANEDVGFCEEYLINKFGGHSDQLSTKYHSMDLWRIRSLVNLLSKYQDQHGEKIKTIIDQKYVVLKNNLLKHQKLDMLKELEEIFI